MAQKSAKELRESLEAMAAGGVANLTALEAAVPLIVEAQKRVALLRGSANEIDAAAKALSDMASAYAADHLEYVFDELDRQPGGVVAGDIEIDDKSYHFVDGFKGYVRTGRGEKFDQDYLETLAAEGLVKTVLELDKTEVARRRMTEEETEALGFVRKHQRVWSENS